MAGQHFAQSPSHPVTQSPSHPVTQSPSHPVIQSPSHSVTQSLSHSVTQSNNPPIKHGRTTHDQAAGQWTVVVHSVYASEPTNSRISILGLAEKRVESITPARKTRPQYQSKLPLSKLPLAKNVRQRCKIIIPLQIDLTSFVFADMYRTLLGIHMM
ncbi:hypothetical protein BZA05DRAFT_17690 [Tricharina praecox]|uniref:uncharacterized protein n=1 Tax=Tricharina praecox TaxID=43433 RepID=UPI00221FA271|nr:uncharacterized protein BZA05DRAFT_17690 [Tricharina praecox]KAI5858944.1 hypothetical protein BZA05DRAFT_17690 [Tricharina praecox]